MLDMKITNIRIVDGTGSPAFSGEVGIKDGKIVAIGKIDERAAVKIDGEGLFLAPGFIDAHTHSDMQLLSDPARACKLKMGVTTEIGGQCGWSYAPASESIKNSAFDYLAVILNKTIPLKLFPTYEELVKYQEEFKLGANQISFVGHHLLRASVIGMEDRPATAEELTQMKKLLELAMEQGALGLSTGLVYAPGCYSTTDEIVELAKVVAKYGGIYSTHMRNEGDKLIEAVAETIHIAKAANVTTNISHLKVMFEKNRPFIREAIKMIEEANYGGANIFFDVYPYDAASATMLSTLPPSYLTHDMEWLSNKLSTAEGIKELEESIFNPTEDWENPLLKAGFDHDLIAVADKTPEAVGKTIHEYAEETGMSDVEAYAYILTQNEGAVTDIRFTMSEEDIEYLYSHPLCMVGTDGLYLGYDEITHPRAFGTFTRFLGRFVRDKQIMSMEDGVRKMTGLIADNYGLKQKGYIRNGYDADLVLFDPDTIIDHAEYTNPFKPNEGIKMVIVGGEIAVIDNQLTGVMNGKVLIREENKEGN